MNPASTSTVQPKAYIAILLVLGSTHLLNDLIQSLIPAIYPIIKDKYALDFMQIGVITLMGSMRCPSVGSAQGRLRLISTPSQGCELSARNVSRRKLGFLNRRVHCRLAGRARTRPSGEAGPCRSLDRREAHQPERRGHVAVNGFDPYD